MTKRHILYPLLKRNKMFPAVGILGVRQSGKTFFLMHEWQQHLGGHYLTFDQFEIAKRAADSPDHFLKAQTDDLKKPIIIDEAHKVPVIFDAIKLMIDTKRRVGRFTLSGSVEFSKRSGIKESLAGRLGLCRLFPLTLAELSKKGDFVAPWLNNFSKTTRVTSAQIEKWLKRGGMPVFCDKEDQQERHLLIYYWLEAICYRDLSLLYGKGFNGDVAMELLRLIAQTDGPFSLAKASNQLGVSTEKIKHYLQAMESLFLIYRLPNYRANHGQPVYILFDSGVLDFLLDGGETHFCREQCLKTLVINEILAQYEYSSQVRPKLYHYRSSGGAELPIVLTSKSQTLAIDLHLSASIKPYRLRSIKSFLKQNPTAKGYVLAPVEHHQVLDERLFIIPWQWIG